MEEEKRFTLTKNLYLTLSERIVKDGMQRCVYSNSTDEITPRFSVVLSIFHSRVLIEYEELFLPACPETEESQDKTLECVEMYIDSPIYDHIEVSYNEPIATKAEIRIDVQQSDLTICEINSLKMLISDVELLGYEKPELTVFRGKNKADMSLRNNMELYIDLFFNGKSAKLNDFLILETQTLGSTIKFEVPRAIIIEYITSE